MAGYVKIKNKYYISASSSLADDRTMVLKDGDCFGIFDRYGDIHPIGQGAQGLYCEGTRFVSKMEVLINGERPLILSSSLKEENDVLTVDLTNPDIIKDNVISLEKGIIHIHRSKFLWENTCYEQVCLSNFGMEQVSFQVSFEMSSDFSDIFEVRGISREKKGKKLRTKKLPDGFVFGYEGLDNIKRLTHIHFEEKPDSILENKVVYEITLEPKSEKQLPFLIEFQVGNKKAAFMTYQEAHDDMRKHHMLLREDSCDLITSNQQFNEWLLRSKSDMVTMISKTEHGQYPYAGIPWYSTPFGRDGILTAWECLWMDPKLTKGVLHYLAATQAKELNDFQDAEPGKIFHEKRGGEMAELGEIPFKLYYGTIDATPLFVGLAGAYYERTNDLVTIKEIWLNIKAALKWIDEYGDLDEDGFVEYKKKSEKGLINQGWKDSHDSIFYEDGKLAEGPIALCEVQGYVYDAKVQGAKLASILGEQELSEKLTAQATDLREKFAEKFWSESKSTFVLALDGKKQPCNVSTSNAGHCLFSGIVLPEHATKLAKTLLGEKMFSSWGIRTAASDEARYNPMSYHNGSVWPHDNALIAQGLARYGFVDEALKILSGLFDVSVFEDAFRLPELFCGFNKRPGEGPTAYPVACSPQAWSVASVYFILQGILGIRIVAEENTVYFIQPKLPDFLQEITIANLQVNHSRCVIQVRRNGNATTVHLLHSQGDVFIKQLDHIPEVRFQETIPSSR